MRDDAVHRVTEARDAAAAELLDDDRLVAHVAAQAAVALRDVGAQQSDLPGLAPQLAIDVVLLPEARVVRHDLALDEAAGCVPEQVQLLVHPRRSVVGHDRALSRSPSPP